MSNLEQGLENNIILLENTLAKENVSKENLLKVYGNLKVLEYRAVTEKENNLLYRIQEVLLDLEGFILE
ncbi:hypothetical protein [Clostridium perfringens]|uniref:hypothetical protein n=1 Tax=Clostridium perfringens TaxID=1502 RepID=UPI003D34674F